MHSRGLRLGRFVAISFSLAVLMLGTLAAAAQEADTGDDAQLLQRGFDTYSAQCSGCHQPGGAGIAGTLYGTYVLIRLDNWAWWLALVFGVLGTRVLFEFAILAFRAFERLNEIRDLLAQS